MLAIGWGAHSHLHSTSVRVTHTSIYARCRFLYGLGQGLGAGSGIRGWVRVRANVYICGDVKDEAFGYNCLSSRN